MTEPTLTERMEKLQDALENANLNRLASFMQTIREEYYTEKTHLKTANNLLKLCKETIWDYEEWIKAVDTYLEGV